MTWLPGPMTRNHPAHSARTTQRTAVNDNIYACANGINDGGYGFDNLQQFDITWYHRFSKTVHIATESWYMYQHGVPNIAGRVANPIMPEVGTNGASCHIGALRCTAPEYAIVNYVEKELSAKLFLSFRSEVVNDRRGQRTGYTTKYSENTLSLTKWIGSTSADPSRSPLRTRLRLPRLRCWPHSLAIHRRIRSDLPLLK